MCKKIYMNLLRTVIFASLMMMVRAECPVGQYNAGSGCQYCPVGQTTTDGTATSESDCASPFSTYVFSCPSNCYANEISFEIVNNDGDSIVLGNNPTFGVEVPFAVTATGPYTLNMADSYNDGWHGAKIHITNNGITKEYGEDLHCDQVAPECGSATADLNLTAAVAPCDVGEYGQGTCIQCPEGTTTGGKGALFEHDCIQCSSGLTLSGRDCYSRIMTSRSDLSRALDQCETDGWSSNSCVPNGWDVSQIKDMGYMFRDRTSFNQDISSWDVSSVTKMYGMFMDAHAFNQSLNDWDVSSVTDMRYAFYRATDFDQPLNDWDVSSVSTMESMFTNASAFNQPLNNWNVSSVTSMRLMFYKASSFNQPVNNWNVASVTNMQGLFDQATSFDQSLSCWDFQNPVITSILRMTPAESRYHYVKTENFDPGTEMPNSQNKNSTCSDCFTCPANQIRIRNEDCFACIPLSYLTDADILDEWQRRHGTCGSS